MPRPQKQLSTTGDVVLETCAMSLYGERGSFSHNLQRYWDSAEFTNACRTPASLEEIPEITLSDLRAQIDQERSFYELCSHALDVFSQRERNHQLTEVDYYQLAGVMGLCPSCMPAYKTLFPHLVDLSISHAEDRREMLASIKRQPDIVRKMMVHVSKSLRTDRLLRFAGHKLWSQGYVRSYFRGENAYYAESLPSISRDLPEDLAESQAIRIVNYLHCLEFALWLDEFATWKRWPFGEVFAAAVAQHYGLRTNVIDMTSDLKTALFFACCCYEEGQWRPLRRDEFLYADSRQSVARYGGDSRYGVLFSAPADIVYLAANLHTVGPMPITMVMPVGFQPFMRGVLRHRYAIEVPDDYDLYQDPSFCKYKFRLTSEMCQWIYREMEGGRRIDLQVDQASCTDIIKSIMESKTYSQAAFAALVRLLRRDKDSQELRAILDAQGLQMVPNLPLCSEERLLELTKNWDAANELKLTIRSKQRNRQHSQGNKHA